MGLEAMDGSAEAEQTDSRRVRMINRAPISGRTWTPGYFFFPL